MQHGRVPFTTSAWTLAKPTSVPASMLCTLVTLDILVSLATRGGYWTTPQHTNVYTEYGTQTTQTP